MKLFYSILLTCLLTTTQVYAKNNLQKLSDNANSYTPVNSTNCENDVLRVRYDHIKDKKLACDGALRALKFFKDAGISHQETITISLVPEVRIPYGTDENGTE